MGDWPAVLSSVISFLSIVAVGLISVLYRNLISDHRNMLEDMKIMQRDVTTLNSDMKRAQKDIDLLEMDQKHMATIEGRLDNLVYRIDRHGNDILAVNERLNQYIRLNGGKQPPGTS